MSEKQKHLEAILAKYLSRFPDAQQFLDAYAQLCHAIDDIIDQDNPAITDRKMHTLSTFGLSVNVFSCPFYQQNISWLYPLVKNALRTYTESVMWSGKEVKWQADIADKERCFGGGLIIAILEHCCGLSLEELVSISLLQKEVSWELHHDSNNKPT